jgi:hypothetical protein
LEDPKQTYTAEDYRRQKWAYKKVFEIFSRVKRRVAAQVWGVSDKESWLGADRQPLLFDRNFEKKPAYDGVREALIGEISGIRTLRIICSNSYLSPGETQNANSSAQLLVASNRQPVPLPQWEILPAELFAAYRLRSMSSDRCLAPLQNRWFGAVGTQPLALNERNQQWYLFPVGNNHFLAFNAQSFLLLQQNFQRRTSNPVTVGPLFSLFLGIWKIE